MVPIAFYFRDTAPAVIAERTDVGNRSGKEKLFKIARFPFV
ncbi:hypothetical protein [Herbaspirillum sp. CF444]|nr:hypothetical protein [Herbaspirillum sp. CF444]